MHEIQLCKIVSSFKVDKIICTKLVKIFRDKCQVEGNSVWNMGMSAGWEGDSLPRKNPWQYPILTPISYNTRTVRLGLVLFEDYVRCIFCLKRYIFGSHSLSQYWDINFLPSIGTLKKGPLQDFTPSLPTLVTSLFEGSQSQFYFFLQALRWQWKKDTVSYCDVIFVDGVPFLDDYSLCLGASLCSN